MIFQPIDRLYALLSIELKALIRNDFCRRRSFKSSYISVYFSSFVLFALFMSYWKDVSLNLHILIQFVNFIRVHCCN